MLMTQNTTRQPRIAAIGLDESQIESIAPMCATLRSASTLSEYLKRYNWTETDLTIFLGDQAVTTTVRGNVLAIGVPHFTWTGHSGPDPFNQGKLTVVGNTEREVRVSSDCPESFEELAGELARELRRASDPPTVLRLNRFPDEGTSALVETTSGWPVAILSAYSKNPESDSGWVASALALPKHASLPEWLRTFLEVLHELDPGRVPHAPPRSSSPADWYTPQERNLASRIAAITDEIERLDTERERFKGDLAAAAREADAGIRRCIWSEGDELVDAIGQVLDELGFDVRDMDAETRQGEQRREDLRLSLDDPAGWKAIAEVKGYSKGTRTSDARQIREQRESYIRDNGNPPT